MTHSIVLSHVEMLMAPLLTADEQSEDEEPATTSADDEANKKATTEQQKQLSKKVCRSMGHVTLCKACTPALLRCPFQCNLLSTHMYAFLSRPYQSHLLRRSLHLTHGAAASCSTFSACITQEQKKKELEELNAMLAEMGVAPKESDAETAGTATAGKKKKKRDKAAVKDSSATNGNGVAPAEQPKAEEPSSEQPQQEPIEVLLTTVCFHCFMLPALMFRFSWCCLLFQGYNACIDSNCLLAAATLTRV